MWRKGIIFGLDLIINIHTYIHTYIHAYIHTYIIYIYIYIYILELKNYKFKKGVGIDHTTKSKETSS